MISGQKSTRQALEDAIPAIQQNLDKAWQIWNNKD
jgi:hypothetical protein